MPTKRIHQTQDGQTIYFLTITVIEWIDIFTKPSYFKAIVDSLKYCQKNKGLLLYGFVIMTNHIHLLAQSDKKHNLSDIIRDFKHYTTLEIKRLLIKDKRQYILRLIKHSFSKKENQKFQIWQRENYPELIESIKFFEQKLNYIHDNPVRKNYVQKPEDWLYSSARNYYLNDNSLIAINPIILGLTRLRKINE